MAIRQGVLLLLLGAWRQVTPKMSIGGVLDKGDAIEPLGSRGALGVVIQGAREAPSPGVPCAENGCQRIELERCNFKEFGSSCPHTLTCVGQRKHVIAWVTRNEIEARVKHDLAPVNLGLGDHMAIVEVVRGVLGQYRA